MTSPSSSPSSTSDQTLPYPDRAGFLAPIAAESARFLEVLAAADPSARVPTCPDWTADDLLWHLTEVQAFWAAVCEGPVPGEGPLLDDAGLDAVEAAKPSRPDDRDALLRLAEGTTERLLAALRAGDEPGLRLAVRADVTQGLRHLMPQDQGR